MAELKTKETDADVGAFIGAVENEQMRKDSATLIEIMSRLTGAPPKLWCSIVGFGRYHYKYASGHEGTAPLLGFSPRKAATSLYIYACETKAEDLLPKLGKYKMGKACIYIKKLSDIDEAVLRQIAGKCIAFVNKTYTVTS